jgi:hypothetical protein
MASIVGSNMKSGKPILGAEFFKEGSPNSLLENPLADEAILMTGIAVDRSDPPAGQIQHT